MRVRSLCSRALAGKNGKMHRFLLLLALVVALSACAPAPTYQPFGAPQTGCHYTPEMCAQLEEVRAARRNMVRYRAEDTFTASLNGNPMEFDAAERSWIALDSGIEYAVQLSPMDFRGVPDPYYMEDLPSRAFVFSGNDDVWTFSRLELIEPTSIQVEVRNNTGEVIEVDWGNASIFSSNTAGMRTDSMARGVRNRELSPSIVPPGAVVSERLYFETTLRDGTPVALLPEWGHACVGDKIQLVLTVDLPSGIQRPVVTFDVTSQAGGGCERVGP